MQTFIDATLARLLVTSIHTVVLVTVVWTFTRSMPRLSPGAQCWLWWLVGLQAVIGLCLDPIALPWLPSTAAAVSTVLHAGDANVSAASSVATSSVVAYAAPAWATAAFLAWVAGVAIMAASTLRHWRRARDLLKVSTPCTDTPLLRSLVRACGSVGLRRIPRMHLSPGIDSPVVVGHFRPVLLLSARWPLAAEELDMALAHELTHLRRGDLWWGCLPALARHLFFFHPLVHLATREYGIAREAGCDVAVVAAAGHSPRDYGNLLVRLGARSDANTRLAVASPTFQTLSRRLTMLQNTTFLPRAGSMALLVVVAVVGVMPMRLVASAARPATPAAIAPSQTVIEAAPRQPAITAAETAAAGLDDVAVKRQSRGSSASLESREKQKQTLPGPAHVVATMASGESPPQSNPEAEAPRYTGERMSGNFEGIDVRALLKLIADTSGRNIMVSDSVAGIVTMRINNVPWDQVLDVVLHAKDLDKRVQGDVIFVTASKAMAAGQSDSLAMTAFKDPTTAFQGIRPLSMMGVHGTEGRTLHADKFTIVLSRGAVSSMQIKGSADGIPDGSVADGIRIVLEDAELNAKHTRHTLQADGSLKLEGESLELVHD